MNRCTSCGAKVIWAKTAKGKSMPLDATPTADGNLVLVNGVARIPEIGDDQPFLAYKSHFATCPNADEHRKPRNG